MKKKTSDTPLLDGACAKLLKPVSLRAIEEAAAALDALAAATAERNAASAELRKAERKVDDVGAKDLAAVGAIADRLRMEVAERDTAETMYNGLALSACFELRANILDFGGTATDLRPYATGEIATDDKLTYNTPLGPREYAPAMAADFLDEFAPVGKYAPDTDALRIAEPPTVAAVREMELARARYERATADLAGAYARYAAATSALESEAATEAESVAKAVATQKERDAANAAE